MVDSLLIKKGVGQSDSVLLQNYEDPNEFIENLRIRYAANCIYVNFLKFSCI